MDRLSEIRARCEAATPGPWFNFGGWLIHTETDVEHNGIPHEKTIGSVKAQNAAFIAHARDDIPYLLSRLEKAEAERDAVIEDFQDFATSGIYNMNPYCGNRCAECTDGRGWCIENYCKGFKVAIEPPKGE